MIEKTRTDGFMARHVLHWAEPSYPTFENWLKRVNGVDDDEKDRFLLKLKDHWANIGSQRKDPGIITRLSTQ